MKSYAATAAASLLCVGLAVPSAPLRHAAQPGPPNVLIIVTDDQRGPETLAFHPRIRHWIADAGAKFNRGFVSIPSCCPSRGSILTGRYAHSHGIRHQGDQANLDHATTIEAYLHDAGYATGIVGKFLNQWILQHRPPHFDRSAITASGYENAWFNVDGAGRRVGYSTTFIGDRAVTYLNEFQANDDEQPWFLYLTPTAPHKPFDPEAQYEDAPVRPWPGTPATMETDRSDKPPSVRARNIPQEEANAERVQQIRTLLSVDDMVDQVFNRLVALDELDNTLVFYLSDNGYLWGEQRLRGKFVPYTNSIKIPFLMRWTGQVPAGVTDNRWALGLDVAPTVFDAVGINPDPAVDGISLLGSARHHHLFTEYWQDDANIRGIPTWASIRTRSYQYVEYYNEAGAVTFREYYDQINDRFQLVNLLNDGDPSNNPDITAISRQLRDDRTCEGDECP